MSDPIADLKQELLAAAERQHELAADGDRIPRERRHLRRNRLLLAAATLSGAASLALVNSQAAPTPADGKILHQKWQETLISTDPPCTVTRGPNEIWIDEKQPHRYRVVLNDLPPPDQLKDADPRTLVCAKGTVSELGGSLERWTVSRSPTLVFVPPDTLKPLPLDAPRFVFPTDPVADLRNAIKAGDAHDEGKTQLDGRTVEHIRIDPSPLCSIPCPPRAPVHAYVEPETFYPIETEGVVFFKQPGRPVVSSRFVIRTLRFEYLPRTAANLALTNIRAQHPDATGP